MKERDFKELVTSVKQAGQIRQGKVKPSRKFTFLPQDVRAIREKLNKSQTEFARMICVSVPTLQNWEQGRRSPRGPARALLAVAAKEPVALSRALSGTGFKRRS
jgi:putative transcriptional regulator